MEVEIQRVYESPDADHTTYRVLIDRLWPRGMRKSDLQYDAWEKDLAPTPELRKWFGHSTERWEAFRQRYKEELETPDARERMQAVLDAAGGRKITLLYGARDVQHNHAVILADAIKALN